MIAPLLVCHCNKHFEITEQMQLSLNASTEVDFLQRIGHKIALDDFGTGQSRYSELKRIDLIKIDKSLVDDIASDDKAFKICAAIVVLARTLGLKIIAEGVENESQLEALALMKCDYAQGYLLGKPGEI